MSAPHNFQCMAAHRESTKLLDSFRSVGLSVAIRPNSGSCQPTKTSLAFGVCCFSSGSEDFFHTNTHLAFIILSIGIPLDLQIVVTLFSTHEFHSFCMAFSNNFLSWSFNFRKFTSTLRCLAAAGVAMKHSSSTPHRKWESSHTSVANTSRDTSRTCSTFYQRPEGLHHHLVLAPHAEEGWELKALRLRLAVHLLLMLQLQALLTAQQLLRMAVLGVPLIHLLHF